MELTKAFRTTIRARLKREPAFRKALLNEAIDCLRSGEVEVAKLILRDLHDLPGKTKGSGNDLSGDITIGSGNVFADIGVRNPEEALAKAKLTSRIVNLIRGRRLTQAKAAALLKIDQPKLAALTRGHLSEFSIASLRRYLRLLSTQG